VLRLENAEREEQVVWLICTGLSNKDISRRLNIGLATTKSHVHNLLAKLELERLGQVVRWSRDNGIPFRNEASPANKEGREGPVQSLGG
jgi:DNA-binding NarL/FixJ family response regulator